jgi:hypothetical protein
MGVFQLDCEVVNVSDPSRSSVVPELLVDTGSELAWLPESVRHRVGVRIVKKDLPFLMAYGQMITRSTGYAILRGSGFETVDEVVFGRPGDLALPEPGPWKDSAPRWTQVTSDSSRPAPTRRLRRPADANSP